MSAQDPYANNVIFLLPMTGAVGSKMFADYSKTPRLVTLYGSTVISTNRTLFGNGSGYFSAVGCYLTVGIPALGAGDFCLDFWVWRSAAPTGNPNNIGHVYNSSDGSGFNIEWSINNKLALYLFASPTAYNEGADSFLLSAFNHVVLDRKDGVFLCFLNGVKQFERTASKSFTATLSYIGRDSTYSGRDFTGSMSYYRLTSHSRFRSNFSLPAEPIVKTVFPDYGPPLITIGNNVTVSGNGAGDYVAIIDATTKELVRLVDLGGVASWSDGIPEGGYYVTYFAEGCQPITHGPYTISAT